MWQQFLGGFIDEENWEKRNKEKIDLTINGLASVLSGATGDNDLEREKRGALKVNVNNCLTVLWIIRAVESAQPESW